MERETKEAANKGNQMTHFKIIAVNDETDTCSCCGRTGLKRVAWVAATVDGVEFDPAPYGTTCAANAVANAYGGDEYRRAFNEADAKFAIKSVAKHGKPVNVAAR